jgi:hypothetical protein
MKVQGVKIKLILTAALMLQMGCTKRDPISNANRNGLAGTAGTVQQSQGPAGNLFGRDQQGGGQPNGSWGSMIGGANDALARARQTGALPGGGVTGTDTGVIQDHTGGGAVDGKAADGTDVTTETTVNYEIVNMAAAEKFKLDCKSLGIVPQIDANNPDTDGDRISDACENALSNPSLQGGDNQHMFRPGLKFDVYNGAIMSSRLYTKNEDCKDGEGDETTLCLSSKEEEYWKESKNKVGNVGEGVEGDSRKGKRLDKRWAKKFQANAFSGEGGDFLSFRTLFKVTQGRDESDKDQAQAMQLKINDVFRLHARNPVDFGTKKDPKVITGEDIKYYSLVRGGLEEAFPHKLETDFRQAHSDFTSASKNTTSIRNNDEAMVVYEFNVVFPAGVDTLKLMAGYLFSKGENKIMAGSKAGMFALMSGSETPIVSSDLLSTKNGKFKPALTGELTRKGSCLTTHVTMAYYADSKDVETIGATFTDAVFYKLPGETEWKPISQDMMTLKPLGDETCSLEDDEVFFEKAADVLKKAVNS